MHNKKGPANPIKNQVYESVGSKDHFKDLIHELEEKKISAPLLVKKYPKLRWCLLNDTIYDLKNFKHPGGDYIIEEIIGFLKNLMRFLLLIKIKEEK